jgi:hypothetical protein
VTGDDPPGTWWMSVPLFLLELSVRPREPLGQDLESRERVLREASGRSTCKSRAA